jgi:signal peptidase I
MPSEDILRSVLLKERQRGVFFRVLRSTVFSLLVVAAVAVLVATLILPVLQIEGTSMEPTLSNGDIVLLMKTTRFDRGDLCAFTWNNKLLVKRVIGLPGDTIAVDEVTGDVYRNGELLNEPYIRVPTATERMTGPVTVPDGQLFVMGDNRVANHSLDSRTFGCIAIEDVVGKAVYRIMPFDRFGGIYQ